MNPEIIVKTALDIGAAMLKSGAETIRVEDTITRICKSYYSGSLEVTSYLSAIFITMEVDDHEKYPGCPRIVTQHRRVSSASNDLTKLEELNALSRYICECTPCTEEINQKLAQILSHTPSKKRILIGYILTTFGFTIFFGGSLSDSIFCALISVLVYYWDKHLKLHINNELIHTFLLSFISALPACFLELSPITVQMDKIMIGTVMLLIPGLALTNSLRDLFTGDLVSGSLKLLNSLLLAIAIAMGFAFAMIITGV